MQCTAGNDLCHVLCTIQKRVDISAHPSRVTPLVISLDLTCGCYEAVYADFEWDIVNVPSPSMTSIYLFVNHRSRTVLNHPFPSA